MRYFPGGGGVALGNLVGCLGASRDLEATGRILRMGEGDVQDSCRMVSGDRGVLFVGKGNKAGLVDRLFFSKEDRLEGIREVFLALKDFRAIIVDGLKVWLLGGWVADLRERLGQIFFGIDSAAALRLAGGGVVLEIPKDQLWMLVVGVENSQISGEGPCSLKSIGYNWVKTR